MKKLLLGFMAMLLVSVAGATTIIGTLPYTITNGQPLDATPLMANFNWIVSQVNGNTFPVGIADGGTGSTTAANARAALGVAASGANSDITSLTGLTTALPITEGGTGATTAAGAAANLSVLPLTGGAVNGDVSITATTGTGLTVNGASTHWTQQIFGSTTLSNSFGLDLRAGTNSSDWSLYVENATGATLQFGITGDGSVEVGSPTGNGQGAGTVNAAGGFYVNGTKQSLIYSAWIDGVGGAVHQQFPGTWVSSVTHPSTGNIVLNNSFTTTANTVCTATPAGGADIVTLLVGTNTVTLYTYTLAGANVDADTYVQCTQR